LPSKEQSEQARQLARQQRELRDAVQRASQPARVERPLVQHQAQQQALQQESGKLAQQFDRMAAEAKNAVPVQAALQRAAAASRQAEQAMRQARDQAQQGQSAPEHQSQERAAQALDQAAREASQAASPPQQATAKAGSARTGEAVSQARQDIARAEGQLRQGQSSRAEASLRQASQSLAQAARQVSADHQPEAPARGQTEQMIGLGRLPGGLPDLTAYGLDKKTAQSIKSWGELPGELRTRIVQDMKARYGEDYARMIKYYFEEIADTKKK
jgi:hypothetical protein